MHSLNRSQRGWKRGCVRRRGRRGPVVVQRVGSMLTPFFLSPAQAAAHPVLPNSHSSNTGPQVIKDYADAKACDTAAYARFFKEMLDRGIMLPPSQFEAWFVSSAHTEADVDQTIEAAKEAPRAENENP